MRAATATWTVPIMPICRDTAVVCGLAVLLLLTACATRTERISEPVYASPSASTPARTTSTTPYSADLERLQTPGTTESAERSRVYRGTGQFVKGQTEGRLPPGATATTSGAGPGVSLNFEGAEL